MRSGSPATWSGAAEDRETGNVTRRQVKDQVEVLNKTLGGEESSEAADTAFEFEVADIDRFFNDAWHADKKSKAYRGETRQGGADALSIWLVDFEYLGVATFPWDYALEGTVDGIRVAYDSLPGGTIVNYNLGETAAHETGHWLGLYHTFQGGCRKRGDEVDDTPLPVRGDQRLPGGTGFVRRPAGLRPDPQLHGLQLRHLLRPVHA